MYIRGLSINWNAVSADSYLREIDAIRGLEDLQFRKPITFFVGENGSGKSTLLEAIAIAYGFNPKAGRGTIIFQREIRTANCVTRSG